MSAMRREGIHKILVQSSEPISATALAKIFNVSRQVIVGDVALLRAASVSILATPRGYLLEQRPSAANVLRTIACKHSPEDLAEELYTIVDHGGGLIDVIVDHPIYGQISGQLQIFSRYDVEGFIKKIEKNRVAPLSVLTDGVHLHTISCPSEAVYERILSALGEKGLLLDK